MKYMKRVLAVWMVCFCLMFAAAPAGTAYASENAAAAQTEEKAGETAETDSDGDEEAFLFLMLGGALLVIIVAVISAVSTVSGAISVAANMDVDGE